ncbi:hypothetical protein GFY24_30220 [Nocardia sp. SYP-A9097]|uniref:hypothetical protein n=1 Tax=Nocardia sp. SYP-A9097 TaxID=2663237 RepID=UPI00129A91DE|nr:hypothetical protein [Nocardia sp. SYP-A9097]MRH91666.1 hypothetical protein [Nocardia sp. SYP-A9097]
MGGAVVVVAVAVTLAVVSVVFILVRGGGGDRPPISGNHGAAGVSVMPSAMSSGAGATSAGPAMPNSDDSDATIAARLQTTADVDRVVVRRDLADRWVPQISSKRFGLVAEGITWNHVEILREHVRLRDRYPNVRLLWSGSWSTFSYANFWITIVGLAFPTPDGALRWCADNAFDADHCYAKLVSETRPVEGSTAYQ